MRLRCAVPLTALMIALCLLTRPQSSKADEFAPRLAAELQAALEGAVSDYNIAGAMALVRDPEGRIWTGHAGWANREAKIPFTRQTRCGIGSTTKTFTSTIILQLIEEGRLAFDSTIEDVLPGLMTAGPLVTVENLLLVESGLGHYENSPEFEARMIADPLTAWPPAELAALSDEIIFPPGDHYEYNNINYIILGLMIEALEGMSWAQSLQIRLLNPLGLTGTGVMTDDLRLPSPGATPYSYDGVSGLVRDETISVSPSIGWSSGAIYSTADDLLAWRDAFFNRVVLGTEMFDRRLADRGEGQGSMVFKLGYAVWTSGWQGFAGSFNDVYTSQWATKQGWDIIVLANGYVGEYLGVHTSATGIWLAMVTVLQAHQPLPIGGPENSGD